MAPTGGPQGHSRLHDSTGRGHIGWKRGEVVPLTNHAGCVQHTTVYKTWAILQNGIRLTRHRQEYTRDIPTGVLFPQVLDSHNCFIDTIRNLNFPKLHICGGLRPLPPTPKKERRRSPPRAARGSHPEDRTFASDPRERHSR